MKLSERFIPAFLTFAGAVGVAATAIMAVRATPKAMRLIEEAEIKKSRDFWGGQRES
jgi:hypothetical protein